MGQVVVELLRGAVYDFAKSAALSARIADPIDWSSVRSATLRLRVRRCYLPVLGVVGASFPIVDGVRSTAVAAGGPPLPEPRQGPEAFIDRITDSVPGAFEVEMRACRSAGDRFAIELEAALMLELLEEGVELEPARENRFELPAP